MNNLQLLSSQQNNFQGGIGVQAFPLSEQSNFSQNQDIQNIFKQQSFQSINQPDFLQGNTQNSAELLKQQLISQNQKILEQIQEIQASLQYQQMQQQQKQIIQQQKQEVQNNLSNIKQNVSNQKNQEWYLQKNNEKELFQLELNKLSKFQSQNEIGQKTLPVTKCIAKENFQKDDKQLKNIFKQQQQQEQEGEDKKLQSQQLNQKQKQNIQVENKQEQKLQQQLQQQNPKITYNSLGLKASEETKNLPKNIGCTLGKYLRMKFPQDDFIQNQCKLTRIQDFQDLWKNQEKSLEYRFESLKFLKGPFLRYVSQNTRMKHKRLVIKYLGIIVKGCLEPESFLNFKQSYQKIVQVEKVNQFQQVQEVQEQKKQILQQKINQKSNDINNNDDDDNNKLIQEQKQINNSKFKLIKGNNDDSSDQQKYNNQETMSTSFGSAQ
ncbi:hypothetical protein PPERSA_11130 [Pseudocohnilembus persalinus]|uniref:Uncharacterized protein n=1 Tax=Pseudocohnilembus persalinus TaxID=266149 RepID=A0A0V0QZT7_PSEPJ|nr:hypothetical protein PPERSA_11130 [Pseudocohnilembus persalinus]|eukprot:KRX07581.1 hypothetical protein PPERSA_11130 [Pseudocohnilembus persalinus]